MKTRTINVYSFGELTDSAKEKAREWYRRASDGGTYWSESVIEDAKTAGKMLGIDFDTARGRKSEPAIYWSGFWSQGDGACFAGSWSASLVQHGAVANEFTGDNTNKNAVELRRIAAEFERIALAYPGAYFRVSHRGHYSHEMCTSFECEPGELPDNAGLNYESDEYDAALRTWTEDFPEDDLIEAARDFMRWIYASLEAEYEYQNSDAQIDESITCNEYEFTAEGEIS